MRDWPEQITTHYPRAVFMDRDGTINVDTHYPHKVEELEIIPSALEAIKILAARPVAIIVSSNQAGIALGHFTREQMSRFNAEIRERVIRAGGRIDAFYFCPELEAKNLPAGAPVAECVKPSPGMLLEAARDFQIDLAQSFMIGDTTADVEAGRRAGCTTILVRTGKAGREENALAVEPTYDVADLYEAAIKVQELLSEK